MQRLDVERRLERIERLQRAAAEETTRLRQSLGMEMDSGERWAHMMLAVLEDLDRLGGEVTRTEFLELGERHGYTRRGMAGFYQALVESGPDHKTRLTEAGRERLERLRSRYQS